MIKVVVGEKVQFVVYGVMGKGNDQIWFELGVYVLYLIIKVVL